MTIAKASKHPVVLLLVQIIIILFCLGYIINFYYTNILPDKMIRDAHKKVDCVIANKDLLTTNEIVPKYRANFTLAYTVDNQKYQVDVPGNGLDQRFNSSREMEQKLLDEFGVGQTYSCWYNPSNPQNVVLILRYDWSSTLHLFIPAVILLITCYYFFRTFSQIFRKIRRKR